MDSIEILTVLVFFLACATGWAVWVLNAAIGDNDRSARNTIIEINNINSEVSHNRTWSQKSRLALAARIAKLESESKNGKKLSKKRNRRKTTGRKGKSSKAKPKKACRKKKA